MAFRVRAAVLAALTAAGVTADSDDLTIKKQYYAASKQPLAGANLPVVRAALGGDQSAVAPDAPAGEAKPPKAPKAPAAPKVVKPAETPEAALARLKGDPATSARWARVTRVVEMGKKGPTRVEILCDDKGPEGQDLFRTIKIQDLFQVKFSEGYAKRNARKAARKAAAPATTDANASAGSPVQAS